MWCRDFLPLPLREGRGEGLAVENKKTILLLRYYALTLTLSQGEREITL
jgi:hypothetical protein